jgi:hypothetical protein
MNIYKLVHDWLCGEKNGKWYLILDNVDDYHVFNEAPPLRPDRPQSGQIGISRQPFRAHLPQSQNGSILMTTRSKEVALLLVEQRDIITVEPMDETHALALFRRS